MSRKCCLCSNLSNLSEMRLTNGESEEEQSICDRCETLMRRLKKQAEIGSPKFIASYNELKDIIRKGQYNEAIEEEIASFITSCKKLYNGNKQCGNVNAKQMNLADAKKTVQTQEVKSSIHAVTSTFTPKLPRETCPVCGAELILDASYCDQCGSNTINFVPELTEEFCSACHARLIARAEYCDQCGNAIINNNEDGICRGCGLTVRRKNRYCRSCGIQYPAKHIANEPVAGTSAGRYLGQKADNEPRGAKRILPRLIWIALSVAAFVVIAFVIVLYKRGTENNKQETQLPYSVTANEGIRPESNENWIDIYREHLRNEISNRLNNSAETEGVQMLFVDLNFDGVPELIDRQYTGNAAGDCDISVYYIVKNGVELLGTAPSGGEDDRSDFALYNVISTGSLQFVSVGSYGTLSEFGSNTTIWGSDNSNSLYRNITLNSWGSNDKDIIHGKLEGAPLYFEDGEYYAFSVFGEYTDRENFEKALGEFWADRERQSWNPEWYSEGYGLFLPESSREYQEGKLQGETDNVAADRVINKMLDAYKNQSSSMLAEDSDIQLDVNGDAPIYPEAGKASEQSQTELDEMSANATNNLELSGGYWHFSNGDMNFHIDGTKYSSGIGLYLTTSAYTSMNAGTIGSGSVTYYLGSKFDAFSFDLGAESADLSYYNADCGEARIRVFADDELVFDSGYFDFSQTSYNNIVDLKSAEWMEIQLEIRRGIGRSLNLVLGNAKCISNTETMGDESGDEYYVQTTEQLITSGLYWIQSAENGKFLCVGDVKTNGDTGKTGRYISLGTFEEATEFTVEAEQGYQSRLFLKDFSQEQLVLDAWYSQSPGSGVDFWGLGNDIDQRWVIERQNDGTYYLRLASNSDYVVTLDKTINYVDMLNTSLAKNLDNQKWIFLAAVEREQGVSLETLILEGKERVFTDDELTDLSASDLRLLRNGMYALDGVIFSDSELNTFFSSFSWYQPTTSDKEYIYNNIMTIYQKQNIALIKEFEK